MVIWKPCIAAINCYDELPSNPDLPADQLLTDSELKKTPLFETHLAADARMVPFGGWSMPVQYPSGIIAETRSVRERIGIFDVSHMGRFEFTGTGAVAFLDTVLSAHVAALKPGRSKYHIICNEQGGIIDDAIVYRLEEDRCLLVVNAANAEADMDWIRPKAAEFGDVVITDTTISTGMIAVQGPEAVQIIDDLSDGTASSIRRFRVGLVEVGGIECLAARTGYTGEDGFELMPSASDVAGLWNTLADAGAAPCGLGARDVLRLEAGLMLHGNDMTVDNNPYEAGLAWTINLDKPDYIAGDALGRIAAEPTERVIAGFKMTGRAIPRHGMPILEEDQQIGTVTSGTHSPTLDADIGMGYVPRRLADEGTEILISVRGRNVPAIVVDIPFYRRT